MPTTPLQPVIRASTERLTLSVTSARDAQPSLMPGHITMCGNCCSCFADVEASGPVVAFGTNAPTCWCATDIS